MGRRILNRKELRADFDAAERRQGDEEDQDLTEKEEEEDEEDEQASEAESTDEEEEEAPKKKKAAPTTTKAKPRSRTAKVTRMRVVWGVFDNSNRCVTTYPY